MDEARLKGAAKRLSQGAGFVGTLLAAAAVTRLLARALKLPLRDWLANILGAYADLLHPIVQYSVGLLPAAFGYELVPAAKDFIIVYSLFAGTLYRTVAPGFVPADGKTMTWRDRANLVLIALYWPLILLLFAYGAWVYFVRGARDWGAQAFGRHAPAQFLRELGFVLAVVAFCMLLNAAGVIGMPD